MRDIDPVRMDELLAGDPPRNDAERELLHMAADLRAASAPAPERLRERIGALAAAPQPARRRWLPAPPSGRPGWMAPALSGAMAVIIGLSVVFSGALDGGNGPAVAPERATGVADAGSTAIQAPEASPLPQAAGPRSVPDTAAPTAGATPSVNDARGAMAAPRIVLQAARAGWPTEALAAVLRPVREAGGVLTTADTGTAADGREDLAIEVLVPSEERAAVLKQIGAALPAETAWAAGVQARTPLSGDLQRRFISPEQDWRDLSQASQPAFISVVVVRGAP